MARSRLHKPSTTTTNSLPSKISCSPSLVNSQSEQAHRLKVHHQSNIKSRLRTDHRLKPHSIRIEIKRSKAHQVRVIWTGSHRVQLELFSLIPRLSTVQDSKPHPSSQLGTREHSGTGYPPLLEAKTPNYATPSRQVSAPPAQNKKRTSSKAYLEERLPSPWAETTKITTTTHKRRATK